MRLSKFIDLLKPTDDEIATMALREVDPNQLAAFEPIARGRTHAIISLLVIMLIALPSNLIRLCRALMGTRR
jgi:hypothetical protein